MDEFYISYNIRNVGKVEINHLYLNASEFSLYLELHFLFEKNKKKKIIKLHRKTHMLMYKLKHHLSQELLQ